MGGGGGRSYSGGSARDFLDIVRKAGSDAMSAAFESDLSSVLGDFLGNFNNRDRELLTDRLDSAKGILGDEIEGSLDQLFGGSVAKHTYVDGLSDVDCLLLIHDTSLSSHKPRIVLRKMQRILEDGLPSDIEVSRGHMAVTLTYRDGMVLQLLPALRDDAGKLKVPSSIRTGWASINPEKFESALSQANSACGLKLVPTIKLAKAINGQSPDVKQLSGYHIESLAISAFKDYEGRKTPTAMLPTFFERAKELVLTPIRDRSGQSVHVDSYLGEANSEDRQAISRYFSRIAKRMRNASASESLDQWRSLFGYDT